jgi:hypothetical protein
MRNAGHGAQLYGSPEITAPVVQLAVVRSGHDASFQCTHTTKRSLFDIVVSLFGLSRVTERFAGRRL